MPLVEKIASDLKEATLKRDENARETLRMVKADLMNREVELGRALDEGEEMAVLQRAVKTRRDSIEQYEQGGRTDLADNERAEIGVIERYLPKAMSEDDARAAVRAVAAELGVTSKKDMGKLIKAVLERHRGVIDGKLASRLAGEILG